MLNNRYLLIAWILYAGLMGFLLGASFYSSPTGPQHYSSSEQKNSGTKSETLEERQEATAEALVDYTKWLTRYTGLLFGATLAMGIATIGLYASGQDQIRLARNEFLSTHRPRIRLKAIWLASADGQTSDSDLRVDEPIIVRLDVVNFGNTSAFITRLNLAAVFVPVDGQLPQRPPYNEDGATGLDIWPPLEVIRGMTFTQAISDGHVLTIDELEAIYHGTRTLYFVGTIDYRDSNGHPMQTAFCRYLKFLRHVPSPEDRGRFETRRNPHYEYKD